jgi:hypothetical protein
VCACAIQYRIIGFAFAPLCLEVGGDVFDGTPKIIVCLTRLPIFSQHRSFQERKFIFPIFFSKKKAPGSIHFLNKTTNLNVHFWFLIRSGFFCLPKLLNKTLKQLYNSLRRESRDAVVLFAP